MKDKVADLAVDSGVLREELAGWRPNRSPAARRAGDVAVGRKPDPLSLEERAEVKRRLAEGRVKRPPPGKSAEDPTITRTRAEMLARQKRINSRQTKGAMAKRRREEAAAAARVGSGAAPAPPEAERQPPPAAQSRDPATDKCACGRWKRAKSPTCNHCASRVRRNPDADELRQRGCLGAGTRGPKPPEKPVPPRNDMDEIPDGAFAKVARSKRPRAPIDRSAPASDPVAKPPAQPEAPALKPRRHGMLWWLCAEDGTRVSGPYGSRKVAEAALMEASDAP